MRLVKIHKVIQFSQSKWIAIYVIKNPNLRKISQTDFEKTQPKLYVNSIYGKTCENQKKRTDIRLVNNNRECKLLIEKPQMTGFRIFKENLAAIDLRKTKAIIAKHLYAGFTVVELRKLHIFKFHFVI